MEWLVLIMLVHFIPGILSIPAREGKCEPNRAKLCQNLYNQTRFSDRSQADAIMDLEQYKILIKVNCSAHLRLFLCSHFIPMCTILDKDLKPCRSLCEEVKKGCAKILIRYVDLPWPEQLKCEQFDEANENTLCIGNQQTKKTPSTDVVQVPPDKKMKVFDNNKILLQCPKHMKINLKKITHEKSVCNKSVSKETLRKLCNSQHECEFQLKDIATKQRKSDSCRPGNVGPSAVKYTCVQGKEIVKSLVLHYGEDRNLLCKSKSRHISIMKVQFKDDTCSSPSAFCSVTQLCAGKHNCELWANDHYIPSDCTSENMNLTVIYACVKSQESNVVDADLDAPGSSITLKCPNDKLMSIIRAEYLGLECVKKEIHCAVNVLCENTSTCVIDKYKLSAAQCKEGHAKVRIRYTCT